MASAKLDGSGAGAGAGAGADAGADAADPPGEIDRDDDTGVASGVPVADLALRSGVVWAEVFGELCNELLPARCLTCVGLDPGVDGDGGESGCERDRSPAELRMLLPPCTP